MSLYCPKCGTIVEPHPVYGGTIMCNDCHAKEVKRIHARDTPTTPEVPVIGKYEIPESRRPKGGIARRVIRSTAPFS